MHSKGGLKLALVLALTGASILISQIVFSSPSLAQTSSKTGYKVEGTVVRMVNNKNQAVSDVKVNIDYYDKTAKKNKTSTQTTSKGLFGKNAGKFTFPKIDTGSVRVYSTDKDCLFTQTFNLTKKDNRTYTCNPNATTLNQKSQLGTEGPIYMSISGGVKDVDGPRGSDNQPLQGVPNATVFLLIPKPALE